MVQSTLPQPTIIPTPRGYLLRMAPMFGLLAMATCSTCAVRANEQTEQTLPYVAYVVTQDTYLRSGPGGRHYSTGKLPLGHAVEVYRHDDNSWCAIRPPDGSFSWIPAHQTSIRDDGTAEILGEQTVARVGSQLSDHMSAVQVLLQQGELVKLHGDLVSADGRWIAIQPPAGEFRWLRIEQVSRTPPAEVARPVAAFSSANLPAPSPQAGWQAEYARPANDGRSAQSFESGKKVSSSISTLHSDSGQGTRASPSNPSDEIIIITGSPADDQSNRPGPKTPLAPGPGREKGLPAGNNRNHPPRIRFHGTSTREQEAIHAKSRAG